MGYSEYIYILCSLCRHTIVKIRMWEQDDRNKKRIQPYKRCVLHDIIHNTQLRWAGNVTRMPDERLPKKVLYGELQEGKRSQGGQKKHYKDTLKVSLRDFNILTESWEQVAQDRTKWHCLINKVAAQFKVKRICEAERKRKERKASSKGSSPDSAQSEFTCSISTRQFRAKIGLYSHQRTHKHT